MENIDLYDIINQKRPRYNKKYRELIDCVATKGGQHGEYSSFGNYYYIYMYAIIIGYRLHQKEPVETNNCTDFASIAHWNPKPMRDYIIMLMLNDSKRLGFNWIDENFEFVDKEYIDTYITQIYKTMEEYANGGLKYLQDKWNTSNVEFRDPFVFVNIIQEIDRKMKMN